MGEEELCIDYIFISVLPDLHAGSFLYLKESNNLIFILLKSVLF